MKQKREVKFLTNNTSICIYPGSYLERQKCYGPDKKILFKKQLFDLEVKGQGPMKVIMVHDTPPYNHAPTHQISLTYLERQKIMVQTSFAEKKQKKWKRKTKSD